MIWHEIRVKTVRAAADAVANLFHEQGFEGVVIEDPALIREYICTAGWDCFEFPPEVVHGEHVTVKAYLAEEKLQNDKALESVLERFRSDLARVMAHFEGEGLMSLHPVNEEDWAESWKQYYTPIKISERITIVPAWDSVPPETEGITIRLDPGMAFGTGNHPTTAHCLRALENYLQPGDRVLDVGTGSGVLAIAAAMLGASDVVGIDSDQVALAVAESNIRLNQVTANVHLHQGDLLNVVERPAQLVVANLTADTIRRLAPQAARCLTAGGYLIGAGIIQGRLEDVLAELNAQGFILQEVEEEGEWTTVVMQLG